MRLRVVFGIATLALTSAACGSTVTHNQSAGAGAGGGGTSSTSTSGSTSGNTTVSSSSSGEAASGSTTSTTSSSGAPVDAGSDADDGMISTTYPAPHPGPPQVITGGGAVLTAPKLVPVFFPNDPFQSQLTDFASTVGATPYWTAATSEYGVGPATGLAAIVLTETAPATIDDSGIQTWLAGKLNGNDPAWPAADANTVYILHYPSTTTITLQSGGMNATSCTDFGGYHSNIVLDGNHGSQATAYAVVPRCASFGDLMGIDAVTGAESHEIIEASTDPHPQADVAYAQVDQDHLYWELALGGGEVGDMCAQFPGVFTKFPGFAYTVQRTWSNASALAGHDPCAPALSQAYFNSVPVLPDDISFPGVGTMKGVKIPVGSSKTVELDLFSDAATSGPWDVKVEDLASLMGGSATMSFALDQTSGQNGQKLHLTIDVLSKGQYGAGVFIVVSKLGTETNFWLGLVSEN